MKKSVLITTALAFLISASATVTAFAEESTGKEYPENFLHPLTFNSITDYTVNGSDCAFAEGTTVKIIDTSKTEAPLTITDCGFEVQHVEYSPDGLLYLSDAEGKTYAYPNVTVQTSFEFTPAPSRINVNDYIYYIREGSLIALDAENREVDFGSGFSLLKIIEESVYAVKDNVLYFINGARATALKMQYTDFDSAFAQTIGFEIEGLTKALKQPFEAKTVVLNKSAYITEIDLNDLSGNKFKLGKTEKFAGAKSALLLAEYGNASVIAINSGAEIKSYVTLTSLLEESENNAIVESEILSANVLRDCGIYSTAFVSEASKICDVALGTKLKTLGKFTLPFLTDEYYLVEYTPAGAKEAVTGYVFAKQLSTYTFDGDRLDPDLKKDEPVYDNDVETVVLVLALIGLILIAIGYLTFVATKPKVRAVRNKNITEDLE